MLVTMKNRTRFSPVTIQTELSFFQSVVVRLPGNVQDRPPSRQQRATSAQRESHYYLATDDNRGLSLILLILSVVNFLYTNTWLTSED